MSEQSKTNFLGLREEKRENTFFKVYLILVILYIIAQFIVSSILIWTFGAVILIISIILIIYFIKKKFSKITLVVPICYLVYYLSLFLVKEMNLTITELFSSSIGFMSIIILVLLYVFILFFSGTLLYELIDNKLALIRDSKLREHYKIFRIHSVLISYLLTLVGVFFVISLSASLFINIAGVLILVLFCYLPIFYTYEERMVTADKSIKDVYRGLRTCDNPITPMIIIYINAGGKVIEYTENKIVIQLFTFLGKKIEYRTISEIPYKSVSINEYVNDKKVREILMTCKQRENCTEISSESYSSNRVSLFSLLYYLPARRYFSNALREYNYQLEKSHLKISFTKLQKT